MKNYLRILLFFSALALTCCFEDNDDTTIATLDINDFVWKGMNAFYVYKDVEELPDIKNDRFSSDQEYTEYLNGFNSPESLFESLIYDRTSVDKFSAITPNYFDLEALLEGTRLANGMRFGLERLNSSTDAVFGFVQYVLPNTNAESQGVTRGLVFNGVNGTPLTTSNFRSLLFSNAPSYTINLATYNDNNTPSNTTDDTIISTENSITLTNSEITENPILTHNVTTIGAHKIGYLMYNNFRIAPSNLSELNSVFGTFNSENITDLVLDLRYNGGGSVSTAIWLASMIAGQLNGDIFFTEQWNNDIQNVLETEDPESVINRFTNEMRITNNGDVVFQEALNSVNLNRLYVLTSKRTASASELVINGLRAHIDVVQIGERTEGKPQASVTIYDSDNFRRANANPSHTYAMQPLIYESANADGFSQYYNGLAPSTEATELYSNLGTLGTINEPLFSVALSEITGTGRNFNIPNYSTSKPISTQNNTMYIDVLPKTIISRSN